MKPNGFAMGVVGNAAAVRGGGRKGSCGRFDARVEVSLQEMSDAID
jgi:hypothetical protein